MRAFGENAFDGLRLPDGWSWGEWSGDYRKVFHGHRVMGGFGGVVCKVTPEDGWQGALDYAVAKMRHEAERRII